MSEYTDKLKRGPLLPDKGYSVTKELSDIFTNLIGGTDTIGIDPQEVGRGYTVQQPEPYQGMPSTPKGFKTVKSLDDFVSQYDKLEKFWDTAKYKVGNALVALKREGRIDPDANIGDLLSEYIGKRFNIKGDNETLWDLPKTIWRAFDKNPRDIKYFNRQIKDREETISKLLPELEKPRLINFGGKKSDVTGMESEYVRNLPKEQTEGFATKNIAKAIDIQKSGIDTNKRYIKELEDVVSRDYKFILKNKDNLIKGFNDFVRQTDDEISNDVQNLMSKRPKVKELLDKNLINDVSNIERMSPRFSYDNFREIFTKKIDSNNNSPIYKGIERHRYKSDTSYINALEEWTKEYTDILKTHDMEIDEGIYIGKTIKKIEGIIAKYREKYPNLKLVKPTDKKD